eukprot:CAMPEP_0117797998 /NCGR_PEP_ID=MMETSP0948-20121206/12868_1 /TAXON_ID=44440 /ORGANISM="Chattonella subsalsa, Strain CCMP2191" /LENGTH=232 /DNA_ID=CAMNT_0005629513 /DNA_START=84 /DNA_END=783 /DNA_ORIENTATION=-
MAENAEATSPNGRGPEEANVEDERVDRALNMRNREVSTSSSSLPSHPSEPQEAGNDEEDKAAGDGNEVSTSSSSLPSHPSEPQEAGNDEEDKAAGDGNEVSTSSSSLPSHPSEPQEAGNEENKNNSAGDGNEEDNASGSLAELMSRLEIFEVKKVEETKWKEFKVFEGTVLTVQAQSQFTAQHIMSGIIYEGQLGWETICILPEMAIFMTPQDLPQEIVLIVEAIIGAKTVP